MSGKYQHKERHAKVGGLGNNNKNKQLKIKRKTKRTLHLKPTRKISTIPQRITVQHLTSSIGDNNEQNINSLQPTTTLHRQSSASFTTTTTSSTTSRLGTTHSTTFDNSSLMSSGFGLLTSIAGNPTNNNNNNSIISNPISSQNAGISIRKLSANERKHLKKQKKGKTIFLPSYVHAKDLSNRLHITMMQLHKAGTHFFPWWPRASERQMKRDGYSMLADLVLRFDECHLLCKYLGYKGVFEHTGIERIRNEHYAMQHALNRERAAGTNITPHFKRQYAKQHVGRGTGPEPTPDHLKTKHIQPKQPVVCIVGHVNHGKTTLLDTLRGTHLAKREDGGITQDLYAYQCDLGDDVVEDWNDSTTEENDDENNEQQKEKKAKGFFGKKTLPKNTVTPKDTDSLEQYDDETLLHMYKKVTFLDTPGHASFFDMRENGTLFSDLVVLIVSTVEGVCPQTLESIEYIKAFKLPVVVALTKTDLPNSKPNLVMKQLREAGLNVRMYDEPDAFDQLTPVDEEDLPDIKPGLRRPGQAKPTKREQITPCIPMSAPTGENVGAFKKALMKSFMITKPQADIAAPPVGLVLESFKEEGGRGTVLRVLMSSGVIEKNDAFISGLFSGKVKDIRVYGDITMNEFTIDPEKQSAFPNDNGNNVFQRFGEKGAAGNGNYIEQIIQDDYNTLIAQGKSIPFDPEKHKVHTDRKGRKTILPGDKSFAVANRKPKLGQQVDYALPGVPLDIVGLQGLANGGDDLRVVPELMLARTIAETRRLELEYPEQGRFTMGGLKVTEWTPPPMLFKRDYKKNPKVLDAYVNEEAILHPEKDEEQEFGQVSDIDTDNEARDGVLGNTKKLKKKSGAKISKRTHFGKYQPTGETEDDDEGSESFEKSEEWNTDDIRDATQDDDDGSGSDSDDQDGSYDSDYTDSGDESQSEEVSKSKSKSKSSKQTKKSSHVQNNKAEKKASNKSLRQASQKYEKGERSEDGSSYDDDYDDDEGSFDDDGSWEDDESEDYVGKTIKKKESTTTTTSKKSSKKAQNSDGDDDDSSNEDNLDVYNNNKSKKNKGDKKVKKEGESLATYKKGEFSHNNPSTYSATTPDWNRIHEVEFEYQRPFVVKGGTAGGVKMILDSVAAFNEKYPDKKIHLVNAMPGTLNDNDLMKAASAVDTDLDPNMSCPVLLYRTKKPHPKVLDRAKKMNIEVYNYTVFDDLLKHMIGTHYFEEMFQDSGNLRGFQPGALFAENPTGHNDVQHGMAKIKTSISQPELMTYKEQQQSSQTQGQGQGQRRIKGPTSIPKMEESAEDKALRLQKEREEEEKQKAFQAQIDKEWEEYLAAKRAKQQQSQQQEQQVQTQKLGIGNDDVNTITIDINTNPTAVKKMTENVVNTTVIAQEIDIDAQKAADEQAAIEAQAKAAEQAYAIAKQKQQREQEELEQKQKQQAEAAAAAAIAKQKQIELEQQQQQQLLIKQQQELKKQQIEQQRQKLREQQEMIRKQQEEQQRILRELAEQEAALLASVDDVDNNIDIDNNINNNTTYDNTQQTIPQQTIPQQQNNSHLTPEQQYEQSLADQMTLNVSGKKHDFVSPYEGPLPQLPVDLPNGEKAVGKFGKLRALAYVAEQYKQEEQQLEEQLKVHKQLAAQRSILPQSIKKLTKQEQDEEDAAIAEKQRKLLLVQQQQQEQQQKIQLQQQHQQIQKNDTQIQLDKLNITPPESQQQQQQQPREGLQAGQFMPNIPKPKKLAEVGGLDTFTQQQQQPTPQQSTFQQLSQLEQTITPPPQPSTLTQQHQQPIQSQKPQQKRSLFGNIAWEEPTPPHQEQQQPKKRGTVVLDFNPEQHLSPPEHFATAGPGPADLAEQFKRQEEFIARQEGAKPLSALSSIKLTPDNIPPSIPIPPPPPAAFTSSVPNPSNQQHDDSAEAAYIEQLREQVIKGGVLQKLKARGMDLNLYKAQFKACGIDIDALGDLNNMDLSSSGNSNNNNNGNTKL